MKKFLKEFFQGDKSSAKTLAKPVSDFNSENYPDEIWLLIFTSLSFKDLCRLASTSKRFNFVSKDQRVWLNLIRKFLTSDVPPTDYKSYFAEHYPLLKALQRNADFSSFLTDVGNECLLVIANSDVLFKNFLKKYIKTDITYECNRGLNTFFPFVANNARSLALLINHFGVKYLTDNKDFYLLRSDLQETVKLAFEAQNKECLRLLFSIGLGQSASINCIDLTMTLLACSILKFKDDFTDFILLQSNEETIKLTISNLFGRDYSNSWSRANNRNTWFRLVTTKSKAVERGLLKVYQHDKKLTQDIMLNLGIIISLDMNVLLEELLPHIQKACSTTFNLTTIALSALNKDSISVFTSILKLTTPDAIAKNLFHAYIDVIDKLGKYSEDSSGPSVRINQNLPALFDEASHFTRRVPKNYRDFIELFIKNGVDIHAVNDKGDTVLEAVIRTGCAPLITSLLKNGCVITDKALQYSDSFPAIKDVLELVHTSQKKVAAEQISNNPVSNNNSNNNDDVTGNKANNNVNSLTTQGIFKLTTEPVKPMTKEQLRIYHSNFYDRTSSK